MQRDIDEFIAVKSGYLSERSILTYRRSLQLFASIVAKPLEAVRDADLARAVKVLAGRYKDTTVQNVMNIVHAFFKFWGPERDCLSHERIHVPRALSMPRYAATPEDFEGLLGAVDRSGLRGRTQELCLRLLWFTGMRVGEMVSLRREHLDMAGMRALVRTEKTLAFRHVYWDEHTHALLAAYLAETEGTGSGYLFGPASSAKRRPHLTTRSVERWIAELGTAAGVTRRLVPHSFRHSRIQRWFGANLNAYDVIMLTGHRSITSLTHYMRLNHPQNEANARRSM